MKKLEIIGYILLLIGFLLKFFRTPFHTWIILASILFLLVVYVSSIWMKKLAQANFFIGLSSVFFFTWLLFLTKFFPMPEIPMGLGVGSLLLGIYYKFISKSTLADGRQWINLVLIILCFIIYRMPKYERYYLTGVKFNYHIDSDYQTWAKYSWFLYHAEKFEEAFATSEKALYIANKQRDEYWVERIIDQQEKIKDRMWINY